MSERRPVVLVATYLEEPFWCLPEPLLASLKERFPQVDWREDRAWETGGYGPHLEEAEVLFAWHLPRGELPRAERLRWVHSAAAGVRRLLHPGLRERGTRLTTSSGAHAPFMAEQVMAWVLLHTRRLGEFDRARREHRWAAREVRASHPPRGLDGQVMTIVGYGRVGRAVADRARPFGMRVVGVKRSPEVGKEGADRVVGFPFLDAVLPESDVVVNVLPATEATRGCFSEDRLRRIKPGGFFVNIGRGSTVDEEALVRVLTSGHLSGAGLDVFSREPLDPRSPLWDLEGVQLTPHVAGAAVELWPRLVEIFADNLERYLAGRPLRNEVDWTRGY